MVNVVLAFVGIGIALLYGLGIMAIPTMLISDAVGPRAYPTLLLIVLLIVVVMLVVEGVQDKTWARSYAAFRRFVRAEGISLVASALGILAYFLLFGRLGYILSTTILLLISMLLLHTGRRWVAVLVSISFPIATYFLLGEVFGTQLPHGPLPF